jgi:Tol biopolymer transport system component
LSFPEITQFLSLIHLSDGLNVVEEIPKMRKLISVLFFFSFCMTTAATPGWKIAKHPTKLIGGEGRYFMQPRWSPDGTLVAFTESNYQGIWVMNADGSSARQITDEAAAGFGLEWSSDSKALLSRVAKYEGIYRYNAVKVFEVTTNEARLLTDYRTLMPGLPHWADDGKKVYMYNRDDLEIFDTGRNTPPFMKISAGKQIQFLKDDRIAVGDITTKTYRVLAPLAEAQYLNLSPSPDRKKFAFEVMGGNLYVMNVDGTGLVDLGEGHRPQWAPDSEYLVYMITEDDGHRYLASAIYIIRTDGSEKTRVTFTGDKIEMNPSWSVDGNKVAFDVMDEGAIYVMALGNKE